MTSVAAGGKSRRLAGDAAPLVSVLITAYNAAPYLGEAIESVLAQTYRPLELIVVDDGSTDGSGDVVARYGEDVRYEYRERAGIGAARNRAVELACGEYFAFMDADDRFVSDKLERQMAMLAAAPEIDMVFGHIREFVSPDVDPDAAALLREPVENAQFRMTSLMLVRREAFARVGPYSTTLRRGVGVDWYARARERGLREVVLPAVVLERRLHAANNGMRERELQHQYLHVLKQALDRRRQLAESDAGPGAERGGA